MLDRTGVLISNGSPGDVLDPRASRFGRTQAQLAYRRLRALILTTELAPGAPLLQTQLMELLGVGRTPLRDALRWLARDGLVVIEPRHSTRVAPITHADLQALFELRAAIEPVIARAAASSATTSDLATISDLMARLEHSDSPTSSTDIDDELHRSLVGMSRNPYLVTFYGRLRDDSLRLHYVTGAGLDTKAVQYAFLSRVYTALSNHDSEELSEILLSHVTSFRDRVWRALQSAPVGIAPIAGTVADSAVSP